MTTEPVPGYYRHFKGDLYFLVGVARHSEGDSPVAVYHRPDRSGELWARPVEMFLEHVDKPEYGYEGPRFSYVGPTRTHAVEYPERESSHRELIQRYNGFKRHAKSAGVLLMGFKGPSSTVLPPSVLRTAREDVLLSVEMRDGEPCYQACLEDAHGAASSLYGALDVLGAQLLLLNARGPDDVYMDDGEE